MRGPDEGRGVGQRDRILGAATQLGNGGHALPGVAERALVMLPSRLLQQLEPGRRIRSRRFPHDRQLRVGLAVRTGLLSGQMSGSTAVAYAFGPYGRLMSTRVSTPARSSAGESRSDGRIRTLGLVCAVGGLLGAASVVPMLAVPPMVGPDRFSYPFSAGWHIVAEVFFALQHLTLLAGVVGLAAYCSRYGSRLVRAGLVVAGLGVLTLVSCEVLAATAAYEPSDSAWAMTVGSLYGVAMLLIGVGLVIAGLVIARRQDADRLGALDHPGHGRLRVRDLVPSRFRAECGRTAGDRCAGCSAGRPWAGPSPGPSSTAGESRVASSAPARAPYDRSAPRAGTPHSLSLLSSVLCVGLPGRLRCAASWPRSPEPESAVTWSGTFGWILAPGVATGVLLAWAEYLRRTGGRRGWRWLALAPLIFAGVLLPGLLDPATMFEGGVGGGAIGVPLYGMAGGYAISGRGPVVARIGCGVLFLTMIPIWALTVTSFGGPGLAVDTPRGLWVALYYWSLMVVLALACAIPHRPVIVPTASARDVA